MLTITIDRLYTPEEVREILTAKGFHLGQPIHHSTDLNNDLTTYVQEEETDFLPMYSN